MTTPTELEAAAVRLAALSALVTPTVEQLVAYHRPDVWQGGRAVRFGHELMDQRAQARAAADQLAADARLTQARAGLLRAAQAP